DNSHDAMAIIHTRKNRTGVKNVSITGGYGMNSIANYLYRKELGEDVELYIDPLADDGGISLGMARMLSGVPKAPLTNLFISGFEYRLDDREGAETSVEGVVERLLEG